MTDAATLLISTEPSLIKSVQTITRSIKNLHLCVDDDLHDVSDTRQGTPVGLVLIHLASAVDAEAVIGLLQRIAVCRWPMSVVILSEQYQAEQALMLLRRGAADYLSRPLDLNRLAYLIDSLTIRARLRTVPAPAEPAPSPVCGQGSSGAFLYNPMSPMGRVMEQVQRVAARGSTVLLTGETGTGKTRLARLIHELSPRRHEPFLVVHCGALSSNLIESEMFGHVRGAFTGADRNRTGKFAEAGRGTLLLDEIDSLSPDLQTKLLRVVEERAFEPVGANQTLTVQARLIVASNRALEQEVAAGRFRSDLYYRLNVVSFHLPPLRDRARDVIVPLAYQFLAECNAQHGGQVHCITEEAGLALEAYDWPGNIRELRNVMERAVALSTGPEIQLADLPEGIRRLAVSPEADSCFPARGECPPLECSRGLRPPLAGSSSGPGNGTLARIKEKAEIARIVEALKRQNNNRLRAAAELGISRMALYKKLHRYGLMGDLEGAG